MTTPTVNAATLLVDVIATPTAQGEGVPGIRGGGRSTRRAVRCGADGRRGVLPRGARRRRQRSITVIAPGTVRTDFYLVRPAAAPNRAETAAPTSTGWTL